MGIAAEFGASYWFFLLVFSGETPFKLDIPDVLYIILVLKILFRIPNLRECPVLSLHLYPKPEGLNPKP